MGYACRKADSSVSKRDRSQPIYRFGSFEVDVAAGRLRKHGQKLRLAGQPLEILIMLLERPGEVVTREEIRQRLWSDETFVDFENSLNKSISKLRQSLSDSAEQPVYIETLPRRGYRFLCQVQCVAPASTALKSSAVEIETHSLAPPHLRPARTMRISRSIALAFGSVALIGCFVWLVLRPQSPPRVVRVVPQTSDSRADTFGGIATDGVRLFFLERRGHRWELSQMPASGGSVQPFATAFTNAKILAVSPDSAEFLLAPFESRADMLPLWTMPSVGGSPRRLGQVLATDATYDPDGSKVTFCTDEGIYEIDRDGMNTRKLLGVSGPKGGLNWSKDGHSLRFHWLPPHQTLTRIWSVDADGSNLHELLPDWEPSAAQCCGKWTPGGRYYVFLEFGSADSAGLWALPEPHGFSLSHPSPVRLDVGPLLPATPEPALDGHHIYILGDNTHHELNRFDRSSSSFRSVLGGQSAEWPTFTPNGEWVIYRGAHGALWRSSPDGHEVRQLVSGNLHPTISSVSPDSKLVAFTASPPGSTTLKIYVVPLEGGEPTELVASRFSVDAPDWAPDGKTLTYSVDAPETDQSGLFLLDWDTRRSEKIPGSEGYWKSAWSADGRSLASVSMDNKKIGIFDRTSQKWRVVARGNVFGPVVWSEGAATIYYQDLLEVNEPVRQLDVRTGGSRIVTDCRSLLDGGVQRCGFEALMPDGSLVFRLTRGDHDVYSLEVELP